MDLYGPIWTYMNQYQHIWTNMSLYQPISAYINVLFKNKQRLESKTPPPAQLVGTTSYRPRRQSRRAGLHHDQHHCA